QEPAERLLVIQILQARPRLRGRRDVHERQTDSSYHLDDETEQRAAPEDVEPAVRAGWNLVTGRRVEEPADLQAILEPVSGDRQPPHHSGSASVGTCPPTTIRFPSWTLCWYSKRPRGGGPDAWAPSS